MLVPLLMTVSLLSHTKHVRHHINPSHRQISDQLKTSSQPVPLKTGKAVVPKLFVLMLPPQPPPELPLPHLLMPLTTPIKLALQPSEDQEKDDLVAAINHERTQIGLGTLALDPLLCKAAADHSREMCDLNYFNHKSPTNGQQTPMDRYLAARKEAGEGRPSRIALGENIFYTSQSDGQDSIELAHQSLMASPEHRDNILAPSFNKVGIGLYRALDGRFWVTEMFLQDD